MNNRIKIIKRYKAMLALMCWCCFFALWVACGKAGVDWMRGGLDAWWIGRVVDWTCGGLDVKAAGKQAEVQKEQESVVDWTLKLREAWQKSKRSKEPWWIGR